jgi:GNAT superfamily N-acetyltransferase
VNHTKKLDNPVWFSLSETHHCFAIDYGHVKFYDPDYSLFGGLKNITDISNQADEYAKTTDNFFIVGDRPVLSNQLRIIKELPCLQMIITEPINTVITEKIINLSSQHANTLYELVNLVQPGYFKKKTALLGNYFGIFRNDELVAVTGERMSMNVFTEVSAVITHPDHTGNGYAKQLVAHTVNNIFTSGKIAYLHVAQSYLNAIKLYEKLGFLPRRKISFWNISK